MLIILLIFALIRTLRGVPLASPPEPPDPLPALALRDTQSHFGQRTVHDIVISCLATIFACTWSAVHPNIPAVTDSAWTRFKRRVTITIYALLAPELLTLWAMEQRLGAKRIVDEYNKGRGPQWTLAHGFFLQMGGFMLCESGRPVKMLIDGTWVINKDETRLLWNIQQKVIDPPRITEEDIKDRSKGDTISKTFIVLQTTWFIIQCIARWSQRLPVTELEVVTLGFAMLNGITYGLWWDKPQNVGRPVFLESKKPWGDTSENFVNSSHAGNTTSEDADNEANPQLRLGQAEPVKESWLRRELSKEIVEHAYSPSLLWHLPSLILVALGRPLWKMTADSTVTKMRVGMFYTAYGSEGEAEFATCAIGALFGSVHLIPSWFLHFSSHQEMWLWRVSAIIITVGPVSIGIYGLSADYFDEQYLLFVFFVFVCVAFVLYPIARIILLTLSLTALRSLPPGALQTIEWTTFIPHL
ncbi:hypothetical protein BJ912DRAFT_910591 [Pholiota molesta]|nr:hypothetical protein BJ912DRAFT_910591 [Pholiota molesta]